LLGEVVSFVELSVDLLNGLTKLGLILAERFDVSLNLSLLVFKLLVDKGNKSRLI